MDMSCGPEVPGVMDAVHLLAGRDATERGRGMGHVTVECDACHDQLRKTKFFEPAHDAGQDPLTNWASSPLDRKAVVTRRPELTTRYVRVT